MPIITVQLWPGRTHETKADIAKGITQVIQKVADISPEGIIVVFEEVSKEHWATGGVLASDK